MRDTIYDLIRLCCLVYAAGAVLVLIPLVAVGCVYVVLTVLGVL